MIALLATAPMTVVTMAFVTMVHATASQAMEVMIALSTNAPMVAPIMGIVGVASACATPTSQAQIVESLCTRVCAL